jgi:hypothetical protein
MKKIYIILLSIIGVISSCTKHEDIIDTSLQPGSILCSDGSIVHDDITPIMDNRIIYIFFILNYLLEI